MKLKDAKIKKNFEHIWESVINRFQNGGFLQGDIVKIKSNAMSNPKVKEMSEQYQEMIKNALTTDLHLKLAALKSTRPNSTGNYAAGTDAPTDYFADIVIMHGLGGSWSNPITVPLEILERVDDGYNFPEVPESLKRKSKSTKPEKIETNDKERSNPIANTKLANTSKPSDGLAQVDKPKPYKESVALEAVYESIQKS